MEIKINMNKTISSYIDIHKGWTPNGCEVDERHQVLLLELVHSVQMANQFFHYVVINLRQVFQKTHIFLHLLASLSDPFNNPFKVIAITMTTKQ